VDFSQIEAATWDIGDAQKWVLVPDRSSLGLFLDAGLKKPRVTK
jgi:hypothetical protein